MGARGVKIHINRFDHPEEFKKLLEVCPLCVLHHIRADIEIIPDAEDTLEAFRRFVAHVGCDSYPNEKEQFPLIHWVIV
jgi:hypothetical protein